MSGLPAGWGELELGKLFSFVIGGDWGKAPDYIDEDFVDVLCIRGTEFKNWESNKGSTASPRRIKQASLEKRSLKEGDILIEISGGGPDQPVGRTVLIDETVLKFKPEIPKVGTNFLRLARPLSSIYSSYLNYYLLCFYMSGEVTKYQGGSNNLRNLKFKNYITINVPIAPLNEQIRIANKLDSLLGKLQATQKRLDKIPTLLKRYRQSVLAAAVSGELTKEWREGNDLPKVNTKNIQEAWKSLYEDKKRKYLPVIIDGLDQTFTNLPQTWEATNVGAVFDVYVGSTPSRKNPNYWNGTIHWVSSSEVAFNLIENTKEKITDEGLKNTSTRIHPSGTVMLAMIGQGKTRGQPAILKIKACHNQNTAAIRVHNDFCSSEYLFYYLWSKYEETRKVGAGNNQKALNKKTVQGLPFPLPPIKEQKQIIKRVEALFKLADQAEQHYQTAKQRTDKLTQSILAKAFRGELVPQDPNDEPASELLARIQAQRKIEEKANKKQPRKRVIKSKPKKVKVMTLSNAPKEYLSNLLREMNNEASAKDLWNKSEMLIDDFYCQLKAEMETNIIEDKESSDPSMRLLKLAIQG